MKKILSVITIAIASLGLSAATFASTLGVQRTIVQVKNATVIAPAVAPSTFDFGHVKMKDTRSSPGSASIYNQEDADKLDADARAHFIALTGLDIATATTGPTGLPTLFDSNGAEIAIVAPFSIGGDNLYNVLYDSKTNKDDKTNGKWTIRNNSIIMQFRKVGVFGQGSLAGQVYQVGSVLSYGYTDHLKLNKDWLDKDYRDRFLVYTTRPGASVVNSLGKSEFHVPLKYVILKPNDDEGKVGYGSDNTYVEVSGPAGNGQATRSITQHVITFFDQDNP